MFVYFNLVKFCGIRPLRSLRKHAPEEDRLRTFSLPEG